MALGFLAGHAAIRGGIFRVGNYDGTNAVVAG
jgi:hypothetical protein